jgi:hypothetical protein
VFSPPPLLPPEEPPELPPPPVLPLTAVQTEFTQLPVQQSAVVWHASPRPAFALSGMQLRQSAEMLQPTAQVALQPASPVAVVGLQAARQATAPMASVRYSG